MTEVPKLPSCVAVGESTDASKYYPSELVWMMSHGSAASRNRACVEFDRRFAELERLVREEKAPATRAAAEDTTAHASQWTPASTLRDLKTAVQDVLANPLELAYVMDLVNRSASGRMRLGETEALAASSIMQLCDKVVQLQVRLDAMVKELDASKAERVRQINAVRLEERVAARHASDERVKILAKGLLVHAGIQAEDE